MRIGWAWLWIFASLASCARKAPEVPAARASGPLESEVYVWQRAWTPSVRAAVAARGPTFERLTVLAAEVTFKGDTPTAVRAAPDWAALASVGRPFGLGLRIGAPRGELPVELHALAAGLVTEAASHGIPVAELQIDYDCPERRLGEYAAWVRGLRARVGSTSLTITALPAWLGHGELAEVLAATDGFVLQVHSLARPANASAPLVLCDPAAARRAIEAAATFGVPFRVALPTYGYVAGFDASGAFLGLAAEGPAPDWPRGALLRTVQADAAAMAGLVRSLVDDRPSQVTGLIWYRLPTDDDRLNWRWPTLRAVMAGAPVAGRLVARTRSPEPGLVDVEVANDGDADARLPAAIDASWLDAGLLASDAYAGFDIEASGAGRARFLVHSGTLAAGEVRKVGWLRLDRGVTVELNVELRTNE